MNYKVLIADDNPNTILGLKLQLQSHLDIEPTYVNSAKQAIDALKKDPFGFAAVVLDFHFEEEGTNGADLAKELFKINNKIQVIICTGDNSKNPLLESLRARVTDFLPKGEINDLVSSIRKCFPHFDQTTRCIHKNNRILKTRYTENEYLLKEIGMVGRSEKMRKVYDTIKLSADKKATVLIRGECGTGKELVAKSLHQQSGRSHYNFVPINCSAIPESLLESELFGHEKGAFTGANTKKIGKFELAHRGTIFLDEIGDMPPILQAKLLRVLQEESFYPVGSTILKKVNVRVVAATNVDLEKAVSEGKFREDLYYRLKVISVNLPALRERVDDIEPLVLHFQDKYDSNNEKRILYKTLEYFKSYSWPGNVRELENIIQTLIALVNTNEIGPDNLPSIFFQNEHETNCSERLDFNCDYPTFQKQLDQYVSQFEHDYIISKVRELKSLRKTARAINMSKSTLDRRLRSWGYSIDNIGLENVKSV